MICRIKLLRALMCFCGRNAATRGFHETQRMQHTQQTQEKYATNTANVADNGQNAMIEAISVLAVVSYVSCFCCDLRAVAFFPHAAYMEHRAVCLQEKAFDVR